MVHKTEDGVHVVVFKGDTGVGTTINDVTFRDLPSAPGPGNPISKEEWEQARRQKPHTILSFSNPRSIDIVIEGLQETKNKMLGITFRDIKEVSILRRIFMWVYNKIAHKCPQCKKPMNAYFDGVRDRCVYDCPHCVTEYI